MYTDFAQVYDRLMRDVPYAEWARYYAGLLDVSGVLPGAAVVECACGTGSLTIPLARMGYRMTGVDLSPDMLNAAQAKARAQGVRIPFVRQNMQALAVQRPVDAVLATCDGVNYLTTPRQVQAFMTAAYAALKSGGALVFDVSTPHKLLDTLGDRLFTLSEEDLVYVWQGDGDGRLFSIHMDIFAQNADGTYTRIQEDQRQRAHTLDELTDWLQQAGFRDIRCYGDRTMEPAGINDLRWHISALK